MKNVAFTQIVLFDLTFNEGLVQSIRLTLRTGGCYRDRYILHVIFGANKKNSYKKVYYNHCLAYSKLKKIIIDETIGNINFLKSLPF